MIQWHLTLYMGFNLGNETSHVTHLHTQNVLLFAASWLLSFLVFLLFILIEYFSIYNKSIIFAHNKKKKSLIFAVFFFLFLFFFYRIIISTLTKKSLRKFLKVSDKILCFRMEKIFAYWEWRKIICTIS